MKPDGNVAFKVTWVYGRKGPFTSACTEDGRRINIQLAKKTWCSQPENSCHRALIAGQPGPVGFDESSYPCNDVIAFRRWAFSAGYFHHGDRRGHPISLRFARLGKLGFLTSRNHEMSERDRIVLGCFRVSHVGANEHGEMWVESDPASRVRVLDPAQAPRYWDYHRQTSGPSWGTGLFRYLPDDEAERLLVAVQRAAAR